MLTKLNTRDCSNSPCYFSLIPPTHDSTSLDHFSLETPSAVTSPAGSSYFSEATSLAHHHPLLALRNTSATSLPTSPIMSSASSFLSRQTAAAHGVSPSRPISIQSQNTSHATRDSSTDSSSSSSMSSITSATSSARCSRCQRTPSIDLQTGKSNMVQYGLYQYYCSRCAAIVGLVNR